VCGVTLALGIEKKGIMDEFVTGYRKLDFYPDYPESNYPTRADCEGFKYMSMVQLCNLVEVNGQSRRSAHNAFGGDNGDIPVISDRQAYWWYGEGHRRKKFVLIAAVEGYFQEAGIDWKQSGGQVRNLSLQKHGQ
jgi:hypothetical protein